ncbi:hypothetical protein [Ramlibacter humi]|uniref:Uncharacterized protein n=1 Tax=Ramlibacter humi TaxID=2530451 RepID=A0A4Z0BJD1_9BURK|nr:hypothetical protein [Ramlibacter humi]TFY98881.1 hypothetical protein EZ216_15035 [Ramlibacter humi]
MDTSSLTFFAVIGFLAVAVPPALCTVVCGWLFVRLRTHRIGGLAAAGVLLAAMAVGVALSAMLMQFEAPYLRGDGGVAVALVPLFGGLLELGVAALFLLALLFSPLWPQPGKETGT